MSSLAVNAITDASGGTTASINGHTPTASNMAGKNRIINGAMMIDQRNAGASVANNGFAVDRFSCFRDGSTVSLTFQQSTTAPAGFVNSMVATTVTSGTAGSGEGVGFQQRIEGLNISDLDWGTANAKTITLSFWVRSSLTGTFGGALANSAFNRAYPFTYTISSADTWEQKTITVAGDTSGTWLTTNGIGIRVYWDMGSGTSMKGTAGAWAASGYVGATGATNLVGTSGATFYITGVQLEVGSTATEFEHRLYGQELALCQRYYEKSYSIGVVPGTSTNTGIIACYSGHSDGVSSRYFVWGGGTYLVTKRTDSPTITFYGQDGTSGVLSQYNNSATKKTVSSYAGSSDRKLPNYIQTTVGDDSVAYIFHFTASDEL